METIGIHYPGDAQYLELHSYFWTRTHHFQEATLDWELQRLDTDTDGPAFKRYMWSYTFHASAFR